MSRSKFSHPGNKPRRVRATVNNWHYWGLGVGFGTKPRPYAQVMLGPVFVELRPTK